MAQKESTAKRPARVDSFGEARDRLSWLERANISFVEKTFRTPWIDRFCSWMQRGIGVWWVDNCTKNLRHAYGLERLQPLDELGRVILVSNHRSFFDMYVINMVLFKAGFRQRVLFPVRSQFFYDHPLGFLVNASMSFWSMYPPIFRDRKRVSLNHTAFRELQRAMLDGNRSAGLHPEGTRNKTDDPYTLLPAQSGVGRLVHTVGARIVPIFINGLSNDLIRQIGGNFNGRGDKIVIVFGEPTELADLQSLPATAKTYKLIADRCLELLTNLGEEERAHRSALKDSQS